MTAPQDSAPRAGGVGYMLGLALCAFSMGGLSADMARELATPSGRCWGCGVVAFAVLPIACALCARFLARRLR